MAKMPHVEILKQIPAMLFHYFTSAEEATVNHYFSSSLNSSELSYLNGFSSVWSGVVVWCSYLSQSSVCQRGGRKLEEKRLIKY